MSEASIKTRNWKAEHKTEDFAGSRPHVEVTGEVETTRSNQLTRLSEAVPENATSNTLVLTLEIYVEEEAGSDVVAWTPAQYGRLAEAGAFADVEIRYQGQTVGSAKIERIAT